MNDDNPLLDFSGLPRFDAIRPAHVDACRRHAARRRARDDRARRDRPRRRRRGTRSSSRLADALDRLDRAWSAVRHLNAVVNTPELRDAYNANLPKVIAFYTDLAQDLRLYASIARCARGAAFAALDAAQRKLDRQRAARLPAGRRRARRRRQGALQGRAGGARRARRRASTRTCSTRRTHGRHYVDDEAELAGVPADVVAAGARPRRRPKARAAGSSRCACRATCRSCSTPTIASLRRRMHEAYSTRASDLGATPEWDNGPLIERILALRHEAAQPAGLSQLRRSVAGAEDGAAPRRGDRVPARPRAAREAVRRARLRRARRVRARRARPRRRSSRGTSPTRPRSSRHARYAYSEQEVRQYFPEDQVLAGLFRVVETIYGVAIRESKAAGVASRRCASSTIRDRERRAGRRVLLRPLRARRQAGRRVDGRRDQPPPRRAATCSIRSRT